MVKISLQCVIVNQAGSSFDVEIDDGEKVSKLKRAIKERKSTKLQDVIDPDDLQLSLAKTEAGPWLPSKDPDMISVCRGGIPEQVRTLLETEMDPADVIQDLIKGAPMKQTIHVLVLVDQECLEAPVAETATHPSRKRRWDELNEVLDKNKKAKKTAGSTGLSYVSFPEIDRIMPATMYQPTVKPIPDENLEALNRYFPILIKAFGDITTGKEAKRLHFIVPVLASVCALFEGGAQILAEETVVGKRVHGDGAFEFVLKHGKKRVCIVEAKRDDMQQGLAQAYVGSEALADVEGLPKVYSIVTNFLQWIFSRSLDDRIERASPVMMMMENDVPAPAAVKQIAGIIYSILSEDF